MDDLKNPISSISFKGFMRATVIKRDDDKLEGRIGVNIHKLMPDEDHTNTKEKESVETPKQQTGFFTSESEVQPIENEQITSKNFYWARPSFDFSNNRGKTAGNYKVPQIGQLITVYFEDNDPQKCRYLPFSVVKDGEKLLELEKYLNTDILKDPIKKPNIEILTKTPNGNLIGFDYNEETNIFVIQFANGNIFNISNNEDENKILIQTSDESKVLIDGKENMILVDSKDSSITVDGKNNKITVEAEDILLKGKIVLDGTVHITKEVTCDKNVTVQSGGVNIASGTLIALGGADIIGTTIVNTRNVLTN